MTRPGTRGPGRPRQASGAVLALALLITACTAGTDGSGTDAAPSRPVTVEESRLLADVRQRNTDAGSRAIAATYTDRGRETELVGWFDYTTHTGYGMVSSDGLPSDRVTWNRELVATAGTQGMGKPLTSLDGWTAAPLDPGTSSLAVVLSVLAGLGADRPDDAGLIRKGGARWLREDETDGTAVTVFAGPGPTAPEGGDQRSAGDEAAADRRDGAGDHDGDVSPIRYWVDDDGLAHRVDVRLGDTWAAVTLRDDDVPVPPLLADVDLTAQGGSARTGAASADGG